MKTKEWINEKRQKNCLHGAVILTAETHMFVIERLSKERYHRGNANEFQKNAIHN